MPRAVEQIHEEVLRWMWSLVSALFITVVLRTVQTIGKRAPDTLPAAGVVKKIIRPASEISNSIRACAKVSHVYLFYQMP
jgi:hypothetical protein